MCECGCSMGNPTYRLQGPAGVCYVIELYPGCRNCSAPPGMVIKRIHKNHDNRDELAEIPHLPFIVSRDGAECPIKCGPDPDEFSEGVVAQVVAGVLGGHRTKDTAHELADLVWDEVVHGAVEVVEAATA